MSKQMMKIVSGLALFNSEGVQGLRVGSTLFDKPQVVTSEMRKEDVHSVGRFAGISEKHIMGHFHGKLFHFLSDEGLTPDQDGEIKFTKEHGVKFLTESLDKDETAFLNQCTPDQLEKAIEDSGMIYFDNLHVVSEALKEVEGLEQLAQRVAAEVDIADSQE